MARGPLALTVAAPLACCPLEGSDVAILGERFLRRGLVLAVSRFSCRVIGNRRVQVEPATGAGLKRSQGLAVGAVCCIRAAELVSAACSCSCAGGKPLEARVKL